MTDPATADPTQVPAAPAPEQAAPATPAPEQPQAQTQPPPDIANQNTPASPSLGKLEQLRRAGFSEQEVSGYAKDKGSTLLSAGFSQDEVNSYLGMKAPDTAPVRQMVQKNLSEPNVESPPGQEGTEKKEPEAQPTFSQSLDTGMGMPVSKILSGGDAPLSPDMRGHLMDAYAKGHAVDAADFMQSAIPAAAQSVWYQKLWHATEAFSQEFNKTEAENPIDKDTEAFLTKDSPYPTQGSALQRLYGISSYDAAQAVLLAARGGKAILNTFPAAMDGFEAFANTLGQETGHPDLGKNIGMAPQTMMEAFPEFMGGDRPVGASEAAFDARHVGTKLTSIMQAQNDLRKMIGEKLGKEPSAVTQQDISSTIATSFKSKAPTADDFINSSIALLGPQKAKATASTLRDVYKDTGIPPAQVYVDAKVNPTIAADIDAGKVPDVYAPLVEKAEAPSPALAAQQKIDHSNHLPEDFSAFAQDYESTPLGLNQALRDYVLKKGEETGNEHLLVVDKNTGTVLSSHEGNATGVSASGDIFKELKNPNNNFAVHHNHPSGSPLSPPDIATLVHAGNREVTAHGMNGAFSQASLTDEFRDFIKENHVDVFRKLKKLGSDAFSSAANIIRPLVEKGELSKEEANVAVPELVNRALTENGVIHYTTSHSISPSIPDDIVSTVENKINGEIKKTLTGYGFDSEHAHGTISLPDETTVGKLFKASSEQPSSPLGGEPQTGSSGSGEADAGTAAQRPSLNLSPEHQAWQDLLGTPEAMTPSALGKLDKKLESIFADTGDKGLPKASKLSDEEFNALEEYGRRVEAARNGPDAMISDKDVADRISERGSIPFAPELRPEIKEFIDNLKRDVLNFTTPMATGSARAQASAQSFINKIRQGQWNASRLFDYLTEKYTPEELKNMWEAMDAASVHVQRLEANGMTRDAAMADAEKNGIGHFALPEEQKNIITSMSNWAQATWDTAKKAEMVEGEGLPFWTPRMAAVIGEDGKVGSPSPNEGKPSLNPVGKNLRTSSGNLKQRKYLTAEETEAAMQARFGEDSTKLVRDIRSMPIALQRLNQAVAGKTLINDIKEMSSSLGGDTAAEGPKDGYFTMDHPSFQTYRPKLELGEDGKWKTLKDEHGDPIFEKTPIYISKEFEGPLKAVLSTPSSTAYKALMDMKGKAMSMIMFSPMIHNLVEYGRALPAVPGKVWNTKIYFEGNAAKNDPAFMQRMLAHGFDPIGKRFFNQDISSIMEEPDLTPGRSWTAKTLGGLTTDTVGKEAGIKVATAIDKMGDFYHNTLLWDRIADLQAGIAHNIETDMVKNGFHPDAAATAAAHLANRYAGAVPKEAMGPLSTKMANLLMFSRSFTVGNWGVMKDMFYGLPAGPKAQLMKDIGAEGAEEASSFVKRKARAAFMMDIGLKVVGLSIAQDVVDKLKRDKSLGDILHGYVNRFDNLINSHKEDPWELLNLVGDAESVSSTATNEPGKQDRIMLSQDQKTGTASYLRLPTGKVGEEMEGWATSPLEMIRKKQSTFAAPVMDIYKNEDYFGHPIYDKDARGITGAAANLGKAAMHILKAQFPDDLLDSSYKALTGQDRTENLEKGALSFVGLTTSKGYPGGPEAGIIAEATRHHEAEISKSIPKIKDAVEGGDTDKARDIMTDLGMTPRQQSALIKHYKNPQAHVNAHTLKTFERIATPDEKDLLEAQQPPQ